MGKILISILGPESKLKLLATYLIKLVSEIVIAKITHFLKPSKKKEKSLMSQVGRGECMARRSGESGDTTELNGKRGY